MQRTALSVAFLEDEPAGLLAVPGAGSVEVRARLEWREPDVPSGFVLPQLPGPARVRLSELREGPARRTVSGSIAAFSAEDLSRAVDRFLQHVACLAATTDAVLEVRVLRQPEAPAPPEWLLERVSHLLREAGHEPDLVPGLAEEGALLLGARGLDERLKERLVRELG
jgi:hypothetical protein